MHSLNWQLAVVLFVVAAAAGVLLRGIWRWAVEATRPGGSCGGCHSCGSAKTEGLVTLGDLSLEQPKKSTAH